MNLFSRKGKSDYSVVVVAKSGKKYRLNYVSKPDKGVDWLMTKYRIDAIRVFAYNRKTGLNYYMNKGDTDWRLGRATRR